jgi:ribosomal protein S18 acetylase RimI-like enzyme
MMDSGNIQGVHVVRLDRRSAVAAGEAFAASHADYPAFRAVFPEPARRAQALRAFFTATVADATTAGAVVAVLDDGRVVGASVWLPPGAFPWSWRRQVRAAPAFARVAAAAPGRFPTFLRYGAAAQRAHPRHRHWYLVALGVRPEAHHRGIGTQLMAAGLSVADEDHAACYLETSDPANVAFYERFGFQVVGAPLALVPGGPTHTAMRRQARR